MCPTQPAAVSSLLLLILMHARSHSTSSSSTTMRLQRTNFCGLTLFGGGSHTDALLQENGGDCDELQVIVSMVKMFLSARFIALNVT